MKVRPAVVLVENDHVLLTRYEYGDQTVFQLPGGNPDPGETLPEALMRELREELGIEIEVQGLLVMGEVLLPQLKQGVLHCVFLGTLVGGIPRINPAETTALEVVWRPLSSIAGLHLYPNVGVELLELVTGVRSSPYIGKIRQEWFG
ncbi:NUDIX hydrolase [Siphonobacter sp. BAB-5405]|uniref:NUDIX domain-containing protein n=1 Tax=Siphonobacter sp. BAB-5405 TaxID=1864825 RepID=UPI000C8056A0|nr:NUDIX hydrolase [Siphonobacter sp. BAB-5405]PMD96597.1 NUDIX hydrolase [Siphonobacter sp. BAB-5405]